LRQLERPGLTTSPRPARRLRRRPPAPGPVHGRRDRGRSGRTSRSPDRRSALHRAGTMTLTSKLKGAAIGALLGPTADRALRAIDKARGRLAGAPPSRGLDFYYDVADPWSHLAAQATLRLVKAYPVELAVHMVTPPASDVDVAPELRRRHALRDARDLAAHL